MIVYVESNFILEMAFAQEESESCESIIALAESGTIQLIIPAICISEPYEVIIRRSKSRLELNRQLGAELRQLSRSQPYSQIVERSRDIVSLLATSVEEEKQRLDATLSQILECSEVLPIDGTTLRSAIEFQGTLNLSPQDSLVYAAVINHLDTAPTDDKCFLNRDSKDFLIQDIDSQLTSLGCRMIPQFVQGLEYIQRSL